jgi:hypothetical protein
MKIKCIFLFLFCSGIAQNSFSHNVNPQIDTTLAPKLGADD